VLAEVPGVEPSDARGGQIILAFLIRVILAESLELRLGHFVFANPELFDLEKLS
jgi:hypothetical protein